MGFVDKFKNLFIEEEEPIKSEVIQVEIPSPVKEEKKVEPSESELETKEVKAPEKQATPIFFDDDYFKELDKPKQEVKSSYMKEPVKVAKEEKKYFKPTPIISPVYGVLDKNYNKDDITTKKDRKMHYTNTNVTIDEVRKKAFGTLEDDLENTLFGNNSILFNDEVEKTEDLFEELIDDVEIKEDIVEEDIIDKEMSREPIGESELFDLIDFMYEKGE